MTGFLRHGDLAGGAITATQSFVRVDGKAIVRVGDSVASHAGHSGTNTMITPTSHIRINGIPVCVHGALASCGHSGVATQSSVKG